MEDNIVNNNPPVPESYEPVDVQPTNPKGKFSFVWGIISCVVSVIVYGLILWAMADYQKIHEMAYTTLIVSILFVAFSIVTLIFGIIGIRRNPRTKAIIGTVFSAQNIIVFIINIVMSFAVLAMHKSYSDSFNYDFDFENVETIAPDYDVTPATDVDYDIPYDEADEDYSDYDY